MSIEELKQKILEVIAESTESDLELTEESQDPGVCTSKCKDNRGLVLIGDTQNDVTGFYCF